MQYYNFITNVLIAFFKCTVFFLFRIRTVHPDINSHQKLTFQHCYSIARD